MMKTYLDQLCWKDSSGSGTSSKELHVQPDLYGRCHSQRGANWMVGGLMDPMPTRGATWKPSAPSISRTGIWTKPLPRGHGEKLLRRQSGRDQPQADPGCRRPWDLSRQQLSGLPTRPESLVGQAPWTPPTDPQTWRPLRSRLRGQRPQDDTSTADEGPPHVSLATISRIKGAHFRAYRSRL